MEHRKELMRFLILTGISGAYFDHVALYPKKYFELYTFYSFKMSKMGCESPKGTYPNSTVPHSKNHGNGQNQSYLNQQAMKNNASSYQEIILRHNMTPG